MLCRIESGENYDVIFLDLYLAETDGIKLGQQIQQIYRGKEEPKLVFVNRGRASEAESSEQNVLYYFAKPYEKETLREIGNQLQKK